MKKTSNFDDSSICALFDGELSDKEATKAIDMLLSDSDAQAVWAKMCTASDVVKGHQAGKSSDVLTRRVMTQIYAEQSATTEEVRELGFFARLRNMLATPELVQRVVGGSLALAVVSVLGWQAYLGVGGVNGAEQAFIDSPLNSVSITQDAKNTKDNELVKDYFQQHQDAIFNGLQSN